MWRFAVACVLLFLGGSVSMADNFTPIINRSSQPMASTPKAKLAEEQTKCWCMGSRPPPICTLVTLCQASGRTWAETAQQCAAKDKSNVVIEPAKYGDGDGSCAVSWIDQSEGSRGINYEVRALCTSASLPEKNQTVTIIVRTLGSDRAEMGRIYLHSSGSVFDDLKKYQRCP